MFKERLNVRGERQNHKTNVDRLACPTGKSMEVLWEGALRGFGGLALLPGRKTFVVQCKRNGRSQKIKIGPIRSAQLYPRASPALLASSAACAASSARSRTGPRAGGGGGFCCGAAAVLLSPVAVGGAAVCAFASSAHEQGRFFSNGQAPPTLQALPANFG